jgi:hypothetical protein
VKSWSRRFESCTSPHTPRGLDVGHQPPQVGDVSGQRTHLTETVLHRLEPVADQLEALAKPRVERAGELLVNGDPHLLELCVGGGLNAGQLHLNGRPEFLHTLA